MSPAHCEQFFFSVVSVMRQTLDNHRPKCLCVFPGVNRLTHWGKYHSSSVRMAAPGHEPDPKPKPGPDTSKGFSKQTQDSKQSGTHHCSCCTTHPPCNYSFRDVSGGSGIPGLHCAPRGGLREHTRLSQEFINCFFCFLMLVIIWIYTNSSPQRFLYISLKIKHLKA